MQLIVAPVVRLLVTLALAAAATLALPRLVPGDDGLGTGLVVFALVAVVALAWSFLDGRRGRNVLAVVIVWLVVGLLLGVVAAFNAQGFAWPPDRTVLTSDLRGLPPSAVPPRDIAASGEISAGQRVSFQWKVGRAVRLHGAKKCLFSRVGDYSSPCCAPAVSRGAAQDP
ncbi:hypothetical protein [Kytococcus sp. HMSC28H12]|uniref:hypothetical protein n=1 Tax=Kytococcus sp. HMSC28H12 TaxID=1581067 RepID=UPI0008A4C4EB|nr:hypothetical protein [Kytococcus sp. HMSC28H12]OFS13073.1 hypothetical protein HMPREF3099_06725 [Kytococcus sp. HMSC28H12]